MGLSIADLETLEISFILGMREEIDHDQYIEEHGEVRMATQEDFDKF